MGRKKKQQQKDLFRPLGDLTSKEKWDQFFTTRGSADSFEWYAEWHHIQTLLTNQLLAPSLLPPESAPPAVQNADLAILVPGCGSSKLSEHLYDAGFKKITNVDFSEVVIADMLRRNEIQRPEMKWRVMDITDAKFEDKTFDAIVDKGGLDALMIPELVDTISGIQYLSKVGRLLKSGGKYICLTLAELNVLDILFNKFRFGWKMSIYTISKELQTFMVVVKRDICASASEISLFMDEYPVETHGNQVHELCKALEREQNFRSEYSVSVVCQEVPVGRFDTIYSHKDLNLGNLEEFELGRRIKLILGDPGGPYFYKGVLLDAQEDSGPFWRLFAVYVVPENRVDDWIFSSEEGQKQVAAAFKAARLLIILLDSSNYCSSEVYMEFQLNPLLKQLAPRHCDVGDKIPFLTINNGIKEQVIVHQVTSTLTGRIVVDEVIYSDQKLDYDDDDPVFRRLTFERSCDLVQSQALLSSEVEEDKGQKASKTKKKKGKKKKSGSLSYGSRGGGSSSHKASNGERKVVDHSHLAPPYQNLIVSGLMLISPLLKGYSSSTGSLVETVVIGLGGGLLPMFMKNRLRTLNIEVVELDPVVLDVAKQHFGVTEDDRLWVCISDGIQFVREKAEGEPSSRKLDILIVDLDSPNSRSGLTCPSEDFVEESFLQNAKNSLSEEGLFVINVICRCSTLRAAVHSSLKKVFGKSVVSVQIEDGDASREVVSALKDESRMMGEDDLSAAVDELERSLEKEVNHKWIGRVVKASKLMKRAIRFC